jgi:hypothetical protein
VRPVKLGVQTPSGRVVRRARVAIRGTTEPGASVTVEGQPAKVAPNGEWSRRVSLRLGTQDLVVYAEQPGRSERSTTVTVTRKRSARELAALRERRRQARTRAAQRRAKAEANFKAAAVAVPYKQLEKNPHRYKGTKVVYRGQIFQIQESSWRGGIMLLSVTDAGYGYWTDNVWVDYRGNVKGAEDDFVTVYGVITGSKTYETQIGGQTYVPRIRAKYVVE